MVVITMFAAFFLAFQAGQMKAMIDVDRIEGRKSDWKLYFFLVAETLMSMYLIISIYGHGVAR
jgi:hypothetical protein